MTGVAELEMNAHGAHLTVGVKSLIEKYRAIFERDVVEAALPGGTPG